MTCGWLLQEVRQWTEKLSHIAAGSVVAIDAEFSPVAIALLLASLQRSFVIVPLTEAVRGSRQEFLEVAEVQWLLEVDEHENVAISETAGAVRHEILRRLQERGHPGLILFSSGSTGKPKAAVHDFLPMLTRYHTPRKPMRTVSFLLFDHIGGINTLFYVLSSGGCLITLSDRTPDAVCGAVERYRIELLPVSPTFINLILLSEAYRRYDLSSLRVVSYGTEPMPESTLRRLNQVLPEVRAVQTYGLSETGIMQTKSRSSDSLWVKLGGEGFETRVKDGLLEIKSETAMLGYLNAPSPFTEDGWMRTGDEVEVDGEYFLIRGRRSEMINVGGQKVYPAEVESVLMEMDGVVDAAVRGEANPVTGNLVVARVVLATDEDRPAFSRRMRAYMKERCERFKIPQKVELVKGELHSGRFKKMRRV